MVDATTAANFHRQPKKMRPARRFSRLYLIASILLIAQVLLLRLPYFLLSNQTDTDDWLAYVVRSGGTNELMLYDPSRHVSVPVNTSDYPIDFSFSKNGKLAFSSGRNYEGQIIAWDTRSGVPFNISPDTQGTGEPLAWSPDGHYLAFYWSLKNQNPQIYIWDGTTSTNITNGVLPEVITGYGAVSWSNDYQLAFTVWYPINQPDGLTSEVYLWDGKTTSNVSQNPVGDDDYPTWSNDGHLAFLSSQGTKYAITVWDGKSFKKGSPDANTFINVAPSITSYYSYPTWTDKGFIAFEAVDPQFLLQVYVWDGQNISNISQNPNTNNGNPVWNAAGRWTFQTFFSAQQLIYVRNAQNATIFTIRGQYPKWSASGLLTFCNEVSSGWELSIWDGQKVSTITKAPEIIAQWQNGSRNVCSSG